MATTALHRSEPAVLGAALAPVRVTRRVSSFLRTILKLRRDGEAVHTRGEYTVQAGARLLQATSRKLCQIHGIDADISGRVPEGPCVFVANHLGYLDPLILSAIMPVLPIAKRELSEWPVLGEGMQHVGVIFVDRANPMSGAQALRRARRVLKAGMSILVFPEGTTTAGDSVLPFKRGIFGIAHLAGVSVVPVALRFEDARSCWLDDDGFVSHYLKMTSRRRNRIRVHFGDPLSMSGNATMDAHSARMKVDAIRQALTFA